MRVILHAMPKCLSPIQTNPFLLPQAFHIVCRMLYYAGIMERAGIRIGIDGFTNFKLCVGIKSVLKEDVVYVLYKVANGCLQ